jgi:hypothetical protein
MPACEIPAHTGAVRSGNASQGPYSNRSLQILARMLMVKWVVEFRLSWGYCQRAQGFERTCDRINRADLTVTLVPIERFKRQTTE